MAIAASPRRATHTRAGRHRARAIEAAIGIVHTYAGGNASSGRGSGGGDGGGGGGGDASGTQLQAEVQRIYG